MVEIVVKNEGCTIHYTPVGSIYVARTMRSLIERGEEVVFGGEGNGGLIFPDHQFCRDGGMTTAMMVFILSSTGKSLSSLLHSLPRRSIIRDKISSRRGVDVIEYIRKKYMHETLDLTDGIKIIRKDSWALVRASGTEPIIRIIVDSESGEYGHTFHAELMDYISSVNKE